MVITGISALRERVVQDYAALRKGLWRARCEYGLRRKDVEHARPGEAQDERRVDHAEHDCRQHQMMQAIAPRAPRPGSP